MKLLAFLQSQGISRRAFTDLIDQWKILVNSEKVVSYKQQVEEGDEVKVTNPSPALPLSRKGEGTYIIGEIYIDKQFLLLYKPPGYVCSKSDPHNATIYEILPPEYKHRYYIGRLDKESRGLVLLTSDPKLVDQYEHPRHGISKEYIVTLNKPLKEEDIQRCLVGIESDGEMLKCVEIGNNPPLTPPYIREGNMVRIVLNEGKKRHIRRMMSALHYHVEDLLRVREGRFVLGEMKEGERKLQ